MDKDEHGHKARDENHGRKRGRHEEQQDAPQQLPVRDVEATSDWKISQETFRRLARTGEFSPQEKQEDRA